MPAEIKRVKIGHIVESQIPEFLNEESPLFKEFLDQYYQSQEHQSGAVDLAVNLPNYRQIPAFNRESLIPYSYLTETVTSGDSQIKVLSTVGWPDKYGLLKIDNEVITYTSKNTNTVIDTLVANFATNSNVIEVNDANKCEVGMSISAGTAFPLGTTIAAVDKPNRKIYASAVSTTVGGNTPILILLNSFEGCFRGFSGIDQISQDVQAEFLNFNQSDADDHLAGTSTNPKYVFNLSNLFLQQFFNKFKGEFLPGFEDRTFAEGVSLSNILARAKDFYSAKGTDTSYKVLFKLLYAEDIDIIKPQDFTIVPSSNNFFKTKNVLVEKISGGDPIETRGNFLNQNITGIGTVSASIYNVEYRPINQKDFYEISLDSTSFTGSFQVPGKTKVLEQVSAGTSTIVVDSTIGFGKTGSLLVKPTPTSDNIICSYADKTVNQFLGVSGITTGLQFGADVSEDKLSFAYAGFGQTSIVNFRLVNVIDNIDTQQTSNLRTGDSLTLSSFGFDLDTDPMFNTWIYNIPTKHFIDEFTQQNVNTYRVVLFDAVVSYVDEDIYILNKKGEKVLATIKDIEYPAGAVEKRVSNRLVVQVAGNVPTGVDRIEKIIVKAKHNNNYFPGLDDIPAGIQNTYLDFNEQNLFVTSTGLPNYPIFATDNKVFVTSESSQGDEVTRLKSIDPANNNPFKHYLVTGDKIAWDNLNNSGLATGIYFVTNINDFDFRLSYSHSDLYAQKYINVAPSLPQQIIYKSGWENKNARHQKILSKFPYKKVEQYFDDPDKRKTANRAVGLLVNGVEIFPSTVFDEQIYYGSVDSITVTNAGKDYDVINGPPLVVQDQSGSGSAAFANVVGSFKDIKLITPGIGYAEKPKITVSGGNGEGAVLESNFVRGRIVVSFKADGTSVNVNSDTIDFPVKHNFELGEEVIYDSAGNNDIGGIVSQSSYFVKIVDEFTIGLHNSPADARAGINTVNIGSVSLGFHNFKTLNSKNTITRIYVKNPGTGYSNKKIRVPARPNNGDTQTGISTADDYFFAPNHNFKSGEIVRYEASGTPANGLSTTTEYYIERVDANKFKLADAGIGTLRTADNYTAKRFNRISGVGTGTHTIKYPAIEIKVESLAGIGSTGITKPTIDPLVTGSIESVYLENGGIGYGCTNILGFHRRPNVGIATVTSSALLKPIIVGGTIVDVQILAAGRGYRQDSEIIVTGIGQFAEISPTISDEGKIVGVRIIDGGTNYAVATTGLALRNRGTDAKFIANVHEWKINQEVKTSNGNPINKQDAALTRPADNTELGLQIFSLYPPNKLRYQLGDNIDQGDIELTNNPSHSPILGFAYDGNPIYGPYGYSGATSGAIRRLTSSYILNSAPKVGLRPPGYVPGYFIEDYEYNGSGDLDEFGGRYCITPQFPDGVYAYFYSIDVDSSGVSIPKFPYMVAQSFKDLPVIENFASNFNQDRNFGDLGLTRNIGPYYTNYENSLYELIDKINPTFKQEFKVTDIQTSGITSTTVFAAGKGYRVGEKLELDNTGTDGTGTNIVISHVGGETVNSISVGVQTFSDVDFTIERNRVIAYTNDPHGLINGEVIVVSGISTTNLSVIEGSHNVNIFTKSVGLTTYLANSATTGISTFIPVTDTSGFFVNDIIGIGTELMRVTSVEPAYSRLGVNRQVGLAETHDAGTNNVVLKPTRFEFTLDEGVNYLTYRNKVTFFNGQNTVGFGSTGHVYTITPTGIGTLVTQTAYQRFVPEKSIYVKDHPYYTGQKLKYQIGYGGSSLTWAKTSVGATSGVGTELLANGSEVYALNLGIDYLGISTVGFPTETDALYWYDLPGNVGYAQSFATTYPRITGIVERFRGSVGCSTDHGLSTDATISLNTLPIQTETIKLRYDPVIRKITTNQVSFSSTTFSADLTSFVVDSQDLQSGDKVVYYGNGNIIAGLVDNDVYYVLREDPTKIKLCQYASDVDIAKTVPITSVAVGTYYLAKINPPISVTNGNKLKIDVSDQTLTDMRLDLYKDLQFKKKLDVSGNAEYGFSILRDGIPGTLGAHITITTIAGYPRKSYYNFTPVTPTDDRKNQITTDDTVIGRNSITVNNSILQDTHSIIVTDKQNFIFNLDRKPSAAELFTTKAGLSTVFYETTSPDAVGPITRTKINFEGKGYSRLPKVMGFETFSGKNAVIKINSEKIGQIESTERIKDGFDYPTDPTLLPFLSIPTVCDVSGIARIDYIAVLDGGVNYQQTPNLKVLGNDDVELQAEIKGGAVVDVHVLTNGTVFNEPLTVIPTRNSNGYDIDAITHSGDNVTVELLLDQQFYKPINAGYGNTNVVFPFKVGDKVYVEGCRLTPNSQLAGELNFNSEVWEYRTFDVVGINSTNYTVTYSMAGINTGTLGSYDDDFTLGYISNYKDMAKFEMVLIDDANYFSGEKVTGPKFSAIVTEGGWDGDLNQLRLTDSVGELRVGDVLYGERSKLNGKVETVNKFNIRTSLGISRDKVGEVDNSVGILNDYLQRVSDNFYYQKFSYSIKSDISYDKWKESVRSILHPSGFKEFSDLKITSDAQKDAKTYNLVSVGIAKSTNMAVKAPAQDIQLLINIDNEAYMGSRSNFAMVTEDDPLPDGAVQRIFFPEGRPLKSYILNKTNKVLKLDDISNGFNGSLDRSGNLIGNKDFKLSVGNKAVFKAEFNSAASGVVDINTNIFSIPNHNFQSGQELIYDRNGGDAIGIATTSHATGTRDIVMSVVTAGVGGSALYENGYNNSVSGVTGVSTTANPIVLYKLFGFGSPDGGLPGISTQGSGARFQVQIVYDQTNGQPISTSVNLISGGSGYIVGESVSIAGTHMGGATPANDLTFNVTKVSGTRVGAASSTYANCPTTNDGVGVGLTVTVMRDANKDVSAVTVVSGGSGYASTNTISIAGTHIGGATPTDNLWISAVELGRTTIPDVVYVQKVDDVKIRLAGLSTSIAMNLVGLGTGTHILKNANPNEDALILVDGIIQSPVRNKKLQVTHGALGSTDQQIVVSTGIGSLAINDVLRIDDEFMRVNFIGSGSYVVNRTAEVNTTVATSFYYDRNRINSSVTTLDATHVTLDDNPPY